MESDDEIQGAASASQSKSSSPAGKETAGEASELIDLSNVGELFRLLRKDNEEEIKSEITKHLDKLQAKHSLGEYLVLFIFDSEAPISSYHSNQIYEAAAESKGQKDILLVIQSGGGQIEPAYLISKTCKKLSKNKFVVAVPRRAKSAATLLALGADEIHMGLMSELGPIDPQINGYPALGLTNALNKVAELSSKFPGSSDMWSRYLGEKLDLNDLGYFDRVTVSAAQYAQRLMRSKSFPSQQTAASLADHFVNHYMDHGFVIDIEESIDLLGSSMIKSGTKEYEFANDVYVFLNLVELLLSFRSRDFGLVGSSEGVMMRDRPKQ